ncbi:MAG: c-type cytochrome [Verrucomicrobiaceae bacterium]|nr:MAG: c-type cytochrome [Verrucomicrobiaceae bacterium]
MARLSTIGLAALLLAEPSGAVAGDAQRGAHVFLAYCSRCHSGVRNGPANFGPNLFGVLGRKSGSVPGFDYSPAMRSAHVVWSADQLKAYVEAPSKIVPGARMSTATMDDYARDDLMAYLATLK